MYVVFFKFLMYDEHVGRVIRKAHFNILVSGLLLEYNFKINYCLSIIRYEKISF